MRALPVLCSALLPLMALAFSPSSLVLRNPTVCWLSSQQESSSPSIAAETTVTLTKPLGLILEEVQEGAAAGVFVKAISESGSAFPMADELQGKRIVKVMDTDCSKLYFDQVMELIVNAASDDISLSFAPMVVQEDAPPVDDVQKEETTTSYAECTTVTMRVLQSGKEDLVFDAKVGDNLRKALLDNGFEVYQGMKQKLGNCGGAGQCTFCAMTFTESDGWYDRSDYEDKKLAKFPGARLSCLNNIQGPATMEKTPR